MYERHAAIEGSWQWKWDNKQAMEKEEELERW